MSDPATQSANRPEEPPARIRLIGRTITAITARFPALWPLLRRPTQRFFDRLAPAWAERPIVPERMAPLEAAAAEIDGTPRRILDLGTGTGVAAIWLARRFPEAEVTGIDISERMIEGARRKLPDDLSDRVTFQVADATDLQPPGAGYDLIVQLNVPAFFTAIARLLAPGGQILIVSSLGARTPFHTPEGVLRRGFGRHGMEVVATGAAGAGTYLVARLPRG